MEIAAHIKKQDSDHYSINSTDSNTFEEHDASDRPPTPATKKPAQAGFFRVAAGLNLSAI